MRVIPVGSAHVRLSWEPVAGADRYLIRRSGSPTFDNVMEIGSTAATFFEDANAATDGDFRAYRVFAVNNCGEEAP